MKNIVIEATKYDAHHKTRLDAIHKATGGEIAVCLICLEQVSRLKCLTCLDTFCPP